jgi:hypothetical protein
MGPRLIVLVNPDIEIACRITASPWEDDERRG